MTSHFDFITTDIDRINLVSLISLSLTYSEYSTNLLGDLCHEFPAHTDTLLKIATPLLPTHNESISTFRDVEEKSELLVLC